MNDLYYSQAKLLLYAMFSAVFAGVGVALILGIIPASHNIVATVFGTTMLIFGIYAAIQLADAAMGDLIVAKIRHGQVEITTVFDHYSFPIRNLEKIGIEIVEGDGTRDRSLVIRTVDPVENERGWFPWSATRKIIIPTRMLAKQDTQSINAFVAAMGLPT